MQIRNNWGELIGDINTSYTSAGEVITSNTVYDRRNRRASTREALLLIGEQLASFGEGRI